ncbi:MAG: 2-C-methyl-D-erythritol 2,4-cyclodiphosphate synthase [Xanthomonadales bacterium]|nr:2-C-methyl-D-erythritol 2,4-cyclodiphosphate synthase [Xanthomonadales bacterium]
MRTRIGQGFDVHAFGPGDHLILGGVRIPHDRGLAAHSDGDVALHALCDALLGAAALGDLGMHFPPGDPQWKDADSLELLARVGKKLADQGWRTGNCDLTIICELPKIAPHVDGMRHAISEALGIDVGDVSVKATTTERLGFCGRGEGIAALAVAQVLEIERRGEE